jgi:hypothetical protein
MQGIPRVRYEDLKAGLPLEKIDSIKKSGSVIVQGGVQCEVRITRQQGS